LLKSQSIEISIDMERLPNKC